MDEICLLHVDDEPDFASMSAAFLERQDERFSIDTATNANEALTLLRSNAIDCVVSDYDMPGQNGIELLETVRDDYPDLPFILFTGKGSEEIASRAISAGVTEYLQKGSGTSQYAVLANRITNAVEQYQARHAFEASQERLSLFIDQSPIGVIEWDENFDFRQMNDKAEEILGFTESELAGHTWEKIVPESDLDDVDTVVSNLLEDQGGYHSLNENVRKDGGRITCEWHNRVVTDQNGSVVAIYSQFQDVTDRVERERELARQRSLLEAQRESVLDGQLVVDETGTIVSYNEQFTELWGIPEELIEGRHNAMALDYVTDQLADPEEFIEKVEYLYDHIEETARNEIELADGRVFDRYTTPLFGDEGTYFGRLWTFRDITERKERERQLKEKQSELRLYEHAVESSTDLLAAVDSDYTFILANDRYLDFHGLDRDDISRRSLPDVLDSEWRSGVKDHIDRALAGEKVQYEMQRRGAEGEVRTFDIRNYPLRDADGEIIGTAGAMRDITELEERDPKQ